MGNVNWVRRLPENSEFAAIHQHFREPLKPAEVQEDAPSICCRASRHSEIVVVGCRAREILHSRLIMLMQRHELGQRHFGGCAEIWGKGQTPRPAYDRRILNSLDAHLSSAA